MRVLRVVVAGVVLLGAAPGRLSGGATMQQQQSPPGNGFPGLGRPSGDEHTISPAIAEKQDLVRNTERQKRMVADTDKLLGLATELKQDVDKTNSNVLSMDVIKKAEEIEKLARSVKERMKG